MERGACAVCATSVVPIVAVALILAWVRARSGWRATLLDAVAAASLGLVLVQVIGWLHYRPRPFEAGLGANLLNHLPENSFPSDHATLMFALSFALLSAPVLRKSGWFLLIMALAVSSARVFLGAHYPSDILGGAALACLCVVFVCALPSRNRLWTTLGKIYDLVLDTLHVSPRAFPRGR